MRKTDDVLIRLVYLIQKRLNLPWRDIKRAFMDPVRKWDGNKPHEEPKGDYGKDLRKMCESGEKITNPIVIRLAEEAYKTVVDEKNKRLKGMYDKEGNLIQPGIRRRFSTCDQKEIDFVFPKQDLPPRHDPGRSLP